MHFCLVYRGELKSNGSKEHKHDIRKKFHSQIKELWRHGPLSTLRLDESDSITGSMIKKVGPFTFATLVISKADFYVELDVTMLRPGTPGQIIYQGGDIDNKLKTLFDALRYPRKQDEIPDGESPDKNFNPFFCLLEDDSLISRINVLSDRLLDSNDPKEVLLLIHVTIKAKRSTLFSSALGL